MATPKMAANKLITTPGAMHHLNRLAVCEAAVALWTGVWGRDERLVGLPVWTAQQVGEEAAGLRHGEPGVSACGRVVESTAAHLGRCNSGRCVGCADEQTR